MGQNLFFISSLGQTYQVNNLVRNYIHSGPNRAVIVCYEDERSKNIASLIEEHLDNTFFEDVRIFRIPSFRGIRRLLRPGRVLDAISASYTNLLESAASVFLSNIDNHYFILCSLAREKGLDLIFYEEGFNTYRLAAREFLGESEGRLKKTLRSLIGFFFLGSHRYRDVFLRGEENCFKDFTEIYAAFPDQLKPYLKARIWREYELDYGSDHQAGKLPNHRDFPDCDILVLSQDYQEFISDRDFARIFASFLEEEFKDKKILVKLHPRDLEGRRQLLDAEFQRRGLNGRVLENKPEYCFPAELLLPIINPEILLAIDSSTLLYSRLICPEIRAVSLVSRFLNFNPVFRRNYKILTRFPHVEIL